MEGRQFPKNCLFLSEGKVVFNRFGGNGAATFGLGHMFSNLSAYK